MYHRCLLQSKSLNFTADTLKLKLQTKKKQDVPSTLLAEFRVLTASPIILQTYKCTGTKNKTFDTYLFRKHGMVLRLHVLKNRPSFVLRRTAVFFS